VACSADGRPDKPASIGNTRRREIFSIGYSLTNRSCV
jgi:hypothetical protein